MKIKSATIPPRQSFLDMGRVEATFEDGSTAVVLEFYPDEVSYSPQEFIGKTREEVRAMHRAKDRAYFLS
ncbi:hypothetical protein [Deinococcus proteolyticus]|nr:hypothetical protein [Deinococcus proteolyticus]